MEATLEALHFKTIGRGTVWAMGAIMHPTFCGVHDFERPYFAGKLYWDITTTQVNSALHPSGVAKSSTSFGWGKGGKVTSAGFAGNTV